MREEYAAVSRVAYDAVRPGGDESMVFSHGDGECEEVAHVCKSPEAEECTGKDETRADGLL